MKSLRMWQVDAFTQEVFAGNPAAVVLLEKPLPDATLQAIAAENNVSETAFLVAQGHDYGIRWFTPTVEVDLCGHATLAAGYVVFEHLEPTRGSVVFHSRSGPLTVHHDHASERITLDFPATTCERVALEDAVAQAVGVRPSETWQGRQLLALFADEQQVRSLKPDFARVAALPGFGLVATAPGRDCDFVSRYFLPQAGVDEDPVTGSTHSLLVPWWAARIGRTSLTARQVSARGGWLWLEHRPPRVHIAGHAVEYMAATVEL
ncbi:MAG: PhzF family phenazine biosynthesis protein [bacterium]